MLMLESEETHCHISVEYLLLWGRTKINCTGQGVGYRNRFPKDRNRTLLRCVSSVSLVSIEGEGQEGEDARGDGEVAGEVVHLAVHLSEHPNTKQTDDAEYANIHSQVLYLD